MKIVETFFSIQGEGLIVGLPTFFIRTAGCNLRCEWCDTKYAWDTEKAETISPKKLVEMVDNYYNVCVTGGEPLLQPDFLELIKKLRMLEKFVMVETNGTINPEKFSDFISFWSVSPKLWCYDQNTEENISIFLRGDWERIQLKFIIANKGEWDKLIQVLEAHPVISDNKDRLNIIIQPEWSYFQGAKTEFMDYMKLLSPKYKKLRLIPQLHKLLEVR